MENGSLQTQTPGIDPQWPTVSLMFGKDTAKWPFPAVATGKQHHGPRRKLPLRHFPEGAKPIPPFVWRNMIFPANEESAWIFIMSSTKREREGWFSAMKTASTPPPTSHVVVERCGVRMEGRLFQLLPRPLIGGTGLAFRIQHGLPTDAGRCAMLISQSEWLISPICAGAGCLWRSSAGTVFVFSGAFFSSLLALSGLLALAPLPRLYCDALRPSDIRFGLSSHVS